MYFRQYSDLTTGWTKGLMSDRDRDFSLFITPKRVRYLGLFRPVGEPDLCYPSIKSRG
jgi:hypothetical protein